MARGDLLPDLETGWETILLSYYYSDNEVQGAVRLNKILADLQLHGFPIDIQFKKRDMGPAALAVEDRANDAVDRGYLEHFEDPNEDPEWDATRVWKLTGSGEEYFEGELNETLKRHPRAQILFDIFQDRFFGETMFEKTNRLIENSHNELLLDNREAFREAYRETQEELETLLDEIEEEIGPRRPALMAAAAALDLAAAAMENAETTVQNEYDDSVGPHHLLSIANDLTQKVRADFLTPEVSHGEPDEEEYERLLQRLEVNCQVYGFYDVRSEEEVWEEFQEFQTESPDQMTS